MSVGYTWKGQAGFLARQEVQTDPITGVVRIEEWEGTPIFCDSLIQNFHNAGIRAQIVRERLPWRVIATYQDSDSALSEIPRVEWDHNTELLDKEWFDLPDVQAEAATYIFGAASYRGKIKQYVEQGKAYTSSPSDPASFTDVFSPVLYPQAHKVWFELSRGSQGYQDAVQVVRRMRTASWQYPFQRQILRSRWVYSPAQLGIPPSIVAGIDLPESRTNTIVGWRLRSQTFALSGERRTETIEFVLAAWSTMGYTAAGGPYS